MVIELWGGPEDGKIIDVPITSPMEYRVSVPTNWTATGSWTLNPERDGPIAFKVGVYEATGHFTSHGGARRIYRWVGVK